MFVIVPIFISILFFYIAYRWYASKLEKLWDVKQHKKVPAHLKFDGIDYVPAKHWTVLFGHHFSSIAGAAPIIGPIIAISLWGWVPGVIWIVLGSIFIGGVHDFGSLIQSVRENGNTISEISSKVISKNAKLVFSVFLFLTLILIIAVFVNLCANTLVQRPEIVLPSWGLILVAFLIGFLMYKLKLNSFFVTFLGLILLVALIFGGKLFPIVLPNNSLVLWGILLLIYSFIASIIPVNILLQPRDYLSAFLLFSGMLFGLIGLLTSGAKIELAAFTGFRSPVGPLWPILFVTIACGAISGFHSLIASGTTSKQLPDEIDTKRVGYGAMLTEGLLALIALFIVGVSFSNSQALFLRLEEVSPIGVFAESFDKITSRFLLGFGGSFAVIVLNAFIFTTLDTAVRIGRYISHELFKIKSNFLASFIIVFFSAFLAFTGQWIKIWPLFGAANQLVAALTFIVLTSWLLNKGKFIRYTLLPTFFMLVTTIGALVYQFIGFYRQRDILLMLISILLVFLSFFMLYEAFKTYLKIKREKS